jgi:hypothetical protein
MARTRAERRHFANKAKNREARKHHNWLKDLSKRDRRRMLGKLSKHRTQCSCEMCSKRYDDPTHKDIAAYNDMQEQILESYEW